jgi:hypothetical protein
MPTNGPVNTQNFLIGCVYTSSRPSASHGFNIWLVDVEGVVGGRVGGEVEGAPLRVDAEQSIARMSVL